jgi:hypothetical protein
MVTVIGNMEKIKSIVTNAIHYDATKDIIVCTRDWTSIG